MEIEMFPYLTDWAGLAELHLELNTGTSDKQTSRITFGIGGGNFYRSGMRMVWYYDNLYRQLGRPSTW